MSVLALYNFSTKWFRSKGNACNHCIERAKTEYKSENWEYIIYALLCTFVKNEGSVGLDNYILTP